MPQLLHIDKLIHVLCSCTRVACAFSFSAFPSQKASSVFQTYLAHADQRVRWADISSTKLLVKSPTAVCQPSLAGQGHPRTDYYPAAAWPRVRLKHSVIHPSCFTHFTDYYSLCQWSLQLWQQSLILRPRSLTFLYFLPFYIYPALASTFKLDYSRLGFARISSALP